MLPNARQRAASKRTARLVLPRRDSQRPGGCNDRPCQGSAFWHRPQWGGDASWPGHRVPSLDLAPVLASPGEKLQQGLGPLTSERPGAPGITNRDDASRMLSGLLPGDSEIHRCESVFSGP